MAYPYSRNYFLSERRERKLRLLDFIANNTKGEGGIRLDLLLGHFSWLWGLRTAKIIEYIEELKLAGFITINSNIVKITEEGLKHCRKQ